MWVPFGQLKNKFHRYDPDKGRGVGLKSGVLAGDAFDAQLSMLKV